MANFGTPTVIGTLTTQTATSGSTYDVPITATTAQGDYLVVVVGSAGGGSNNIPSNIADTQSQTGYSIVPNATSAGVGELSAWILPNSKVLTNTDTVNVTFPATNTFLKNIIVIDCPGALILDNAAVGNNSGTVATNGQPTLNINTTATTELLLFIEQNSNSGGSPSISAPFTTLSTLHSGSAEYTAVSYQIVNAAPGSTTGNATITTGTWATVSIGLLNTIPLYVEQQPFNVMAPPALAFNPALQFRTPPPQPPIPTVISSAPVNITGAQSNVYVNGVNSLTGNSTDFNSGTGNWTNGGNTTQAQTNAVSHNARGALQLTATAGGTLNALSSTSAKITTNGIACVSTDTIFVAGWVLAAATPRSAQIGVSFLDANAAVLGTTFATPSVTDSTGVWQLVWGEVTGASFPTAAWARVSMQWNSVGASEVHYLSDVWLFNVTQGSGMGELIQVFQVENQQFLLSPNGLPSPMNLNPAFFGMRRQEGTALPTVFQPGVTANVSVSAGAGTPTYPVNIPPQFPFISPLPAPLKFVPSLAYQMPQNSTTPPTIFIDGGNSAQVTVNANFPDIAAVVSVTADPPPNISVVAPSPPTVVTGVTVNVNVTAPTGNEVVIVVASSAVNVSVSAIAGSIKETMIGSVANVNVASVAGVATVTPVGLPAQVNVAAQNGSIREAVIGTAGNVNVASSGVAVVTPQGPTALVSAQAISGIATDIMVGQVSTVAVASTGNYSASIAGTASNISVAANPGTPGKTVQGVTANVSVTSIAGAQITLTGVTQNVSVSAVAGSVPKSIQGVTATVNVVAPAGLAGLIEFEAALSDPDLAEDLILSRQGKLLDVPVANMLVSADEI